VQQQMSTRFAQMGAPIDPMTGMVNWNALGQAGSYAAMQATQRPQTMWQPSYDMQTMINQGMSAYTGAYTQGGLVPFTQPMAGDPYAWMGAATPHVIQYAQPQQPTSFMQQQQAQPQFQFLTDAAAAAVAAVAAASATGEAG